MENIPRKIIVHHTGDADARSQLDKINIAHKDRGFPQSNAGYFVGYHFLIDRLGNSVRLRADDEYGAHDAGENIDSLGVALEGDFDTVLPTREQVAALGGLLGTLCERWNLGASDIFPHRFRDSTSCYGALLSDDWARIVYLEAYGARLRDKLLQVCKENGLKPF